MTTAGEAEFRSGIEALRKSLAEITDQQLAEMAPHERDFVLHNRAALKAFDAAEEAEAGRD